MKATVVASLVIVAGLFAACSKPESSPAASASPAAAPATGPRTINIQASDTMKYDVTSIQAAPGEEIRVVLTNAGTQPKEVMGHNWTLLKADADPAAFAAAAISAKDTGYMPPSLQGEVIAHIDQLGPKQSGEVTFKAPTTPGDYPYLCTFPAHFQVGMKGVLTVK